MTSDQKLEICKQTRKYASDSLYKVLKKLLASDKPISEVLLRDTWLKELRKNNDIFPDGWYTPPPQGIIVLFADDKNVERVSYKSARPEENWPKDNIFLNTKSGIAYFYASPVDQKTAIIGDFGMTLYFGNKPETINLLKTCLTLDREIFNYSKIGMELSEATLFAEKRMKHFGLQNVIVNITDKAAVNDKKVISIGHSIPAIHKDWNEKEKQILSKGLLNWDNAKNLISNNRIFENSIEKFTIKQGFAFTIEPRAKVISNPSLPASLSFHTIALFKQNGEKELLTNFDDLFKLAGMKYMLK